MPTTSALKLENVVSAPRKPVTSASRHTGSNSGRLLNTATHTPTFAFVAPTATPTPGLTPTLVLPTYTPTWTPSFTPTFLGSMYIHYQLPFWSLLLITIGGQAIGEPLAAVFAWQRSQLAQKLRPVVLG